MANGTRGKGTIPVKKGSAGPAQRVEEAGLRGARLDQAPKKHQLDARQERIAPKRKPGPPLREGEPSGLRARQAAARDSVPETECDESGE